MIYQFHEGERIRNGFNYQLATHTSKFILALKLWRFMIYLRIRQPYTEGKKIILAWDWFHPMRIGALEFEFDTRSVKVGNERFSADLLEDLAGLREGQIAKLGKKDGWLTWLS